MPSFRALVQAAVMAPSGSAGSCSSSTFASPSERSSGTCGASGSHDPPGQRWATFLRDHAHETWACDFLQTYDLLFRPTFAFSLIELGSRRVERVGVTRSPASAWVTQQLREAMAWGEGPRFLIRDNDDKSGRLREPPFSVGSTTITGGPPSSDGSGSQSGSMCSTIQPQTQVVAKR